jgi:ATP/maltotriose-dependent transcriptional regulator MalT
MDRTPIAKLLPPSQPVGFIARPALAGLITSVLGRRLTVVVAEAGFGKSTLMASWWDAAPCAWYTVDHTDQDLPSMGRQLCDALRLRVPDLSGEPSRSAEGAGGPEPEQLSRADALAARLAEMLHEQLTTDLVLVIDDLHELDASSPCSRLVEALCRHTPPRLHLVLASRRPPPFAVERLRGQGQLLEITGAQLAFTRQEVAELVEGRLGVADTGLAANLHRLAGGWPAAVILAIEALRTSPPETWAAVLTGLEHPDAPLFAYLAEEVFGRHPSTVRDLVSRLALLDTFSPELADALGIPNCRRILADLAREGLFVERRQDGSMALRPLIRDYALDRLPVPSSQAVNLRATAAEWLAHNGDAAAAIRVLLSAEVTENLAAILVKEGQALLASGQVVTVLDACRSLPTRLRTTRIDQLEGEALQIHGDWTGALSCFERAAAGQAALPANLAWRIGVIHYLRGDPGAALEVYRRGADDPDADAVEVALLLAWMSTAHWVRGEVDPCRELATRALATANACGDLRALAAAHTVMAMLAALDGDRRGNDAHYLLALRAAEEAHDVLQTVRIRTNRGSHFMEEGSYTEALQELEVAVRLAELTSFASFLALGLSNRGETKLRMGRLDEALTDLESSRARYEQIGSDMVAYPLTLIGEIYRERGNLAQARAAFEEAHATLEQSGDVQGLVPTLAGLATVLAFEDPERARQLADQAVSSDANLGYVSALLAAGWVALVAGDRRRGGELATTAASVARARRDRAGLADALALAAMSAEQQRIKTQRLTEAAAIWREIGNPLAEATVELALASVEPGPGAVARRMRAEHQLESLGLHAHVGGNAAAGLLAFVGRREPVALRLQSLGGFSILRDDHLVRISEWQSKRARELLKLLVARRGRPAPRAYLMETLWPGEEPEKVANRLSVALTTIRSVLDPQRRFPPDRFVLADSDTVAINLDAVDVDLEQFLAATSDGLAHLRRGETQRAMPILEAATVTYAGDFLEENPYDDWAAPAREEARAAYVAASRALAVHAATSPDPDAAVPHFLRILEIDRYDEQAYLGLVAALADAGRHGEAHRHYLSYHHAMDDLGVEPAPFPSGRRGAVSAPMRTPAAFSQH